MAKPLRIALLGYGAINRRVAQLLQTRAHSGRIVAVVLRRLLDPRPPELLGVEQVRTPERLKQLAPDLILEAASAAAVSQWGKIALGSARAVALSSVSALANEALRLELEESAARMGSRLLISPGAVGGLDVLAAASRLNMESMRHRIVKSPASLPQAQVPTPLPAGPVIIFRGSAREAALAYPQNANATVATALASVGLDRAVVEVVADPSATENRHEIDAVGDFGSLHIELRNRPLSTNPKSSELAALALLRIAENQSASIIL